MFYVGFFLLSVPFILPLPWKWVSLPLLPPLLDKTYVFFYYPLDHPEFGRVSLVSSFFFPLWNRPFAPPNFRPPSSLCRRIVHYFPCTACDFGLHFFTCPVFYLLRRAFRLFRVVRSSKQSKLSYFGFLQAGFQYFPQLFRWRCVLFPHFFLSGLRFFFFSHLCYWHRRFQFD